MNKKLILFLSFSVYLLGLSPAALAMEPLDKAEASSAAPNYNDVRAFHAACRAGNFDQVRESVRHGVDINAKISNNMSALCFAVTARRIELARLLIELGADVEDKDAEGMTPLCAAIVMSNIEIARFLIAHGANVNANLNNGQTLLSVVALGGSAEFIHLLLEHGADASLQDIYGNGALHHFSGGFKKNMSSQALKQCLEALVGAGADINAKNNEGFTPLVFALSRDNPDFFRLLLEFGADSNLVDRYGNTALHYVILRKDRERVELLLKHGVDKKIKNKFGQTAQDYDRSNILAHIKKAGQKSAQNKNKSKKDKKKKSKNTLTYAQRQDRKPQPAAVPKAAEGVSVGVVEKPAGDVKLWLAPRVTRWGNQEFLDAKEVECKADVRKGYWYFMRSKLYHQLPLDVLRVVALNGDPEKWKSKKHPDQVRVRRVLEGRMIFADPATNPWNPGKSRQGGFYHCTPDADGQIYHVGFDATDEGTSITLADFITDKSLKPDVNNIIINDGVHCIQHELFMPNK